MDKSGRKLGDIDWGSDISRYYRAHIFAPWFAHWLHDKPLMEPEALTFETGTNVWKSYDEWPPKKGITEKKLYFRSGGKLSFEPPSRARRHLILMSLIRRTLCLIATGRSHPLIPRLPGRPGWYRISASWSTVRTY